MAIFKNKGDGENPAEKPQKFTRKGKPIKHPVLRIVGRVLLVLLALLLVFVICMFVSCRTASESPGISQSDLLLPTPSEEMAHMYSEFENNDGNLYQSIDGLGQEQSQETFSHATPPDSPSSSYTGTEVPEIEAAYCLTCHTQSAIDNLSGDEESVRATIERMRESYSAPLSNEQVDALVDAHSK